LLLAEKKMTSAFWRAREKDGWERMSRLSEKSSVCVVGLRGLLKAIAEVVVVARGRSMRKWKTISSLRR
jgi:hypothetical protein